ncbi:hypothetical protein, partial [Escherichia coli]|uniref:hypothetical protein n=1 Tax=Escherichia coli TaxID=562 RepID=UPI0032D9C7C0
GSKFISDRTPRNFRSVLNLAHFEAFDWNKFVVSEIILSGLFSTETLSVWTTTDMLWRYFIILLFLFPSLSHKGYI